MTTTYTVTLDGDDLVTLNDALYYLTHPGDDSGPEADEVAAGEALIAKLLRNSRRNWTRCARRDRSDE